VSVTLAGLFGDIKLILQTSYANHEIFSVRTEKISNVFQIHEFFWRFRSSSKIHHALLSRVHAA